LIAAAGVGSVLSDAAPLSRAPYCYVFPPSSRPWSSHSRASGPGSRRHHRVRDASAHRVVVAVTLLIGLPLVRGISGRHALDA